MNQVAGTLKLELAQYREVAAFAQFGSDLDAATQQQLLRGSVLTDLLKQKQFVPMQVEDIVASVFAGANGYLDKIALSQIPIFEEKWLAYLKASQPTILTEVRDKGAISDDLLATMHAAMGSFMGENEFVMRATA